MALQGQAPTDYAQAAEIWRCRCQLSSGDETGYSGYNWFRSRDEYPGSTGDVARGQG